MDDSLSLASVEPFRGDYKGWGAKAAAGDALSRVPDGAVFVAVWLDEDGYPKWSMANDGPWKLAALAMVLQELAGAAARDVMR